MHVGDETKIHFVEELKYIREMPPTVGLVKLKAIHDLLCEIMDELTREDTIFFPTLFSKISFLKQKIGLPNDIHRSLNYFRIAFNKLHRNHNFSNPEVTALSNLGLGITHFFLINHFKMQPDHEGLFLVDSRWISTKSIYSEKSSIPFVKGLIVQIDIAGKILFFRSEEEEDEHLITVHFHKNNVNEIYTDSLIQASTRFQLPISCRLVDIQVDASGAYYPKHFILEPDYLFDVTAIASCFDFKEAIPEQYLLSKFTSKSTGLALLIGDIANFFLDKLISEPALTFEVLFPLVFKKKPLSFALISDSEVLLIRDSAKNIYANLTKTIREDFPKYNISPKHCYLEPTFLSEKFGIQGRLDLLYEGPDKKVIIELKSGKTFRTNQFGINIPHFFQFLLYDLLIQSTTGKNKVLGFVLYAAYPESLRFAPHNVLDQQKALNLRNKLVFIELNLISLGLQDDLLEAGSRLLNDLFLRVSEAKGFFKTNLEQFLSTVKSVTNLEKKYFFSFISFIAREKKLAKTGSYQFQNGASGQASLWLETISDKQENFNILNHLALKEFKDNQIKFVKTEITAQRANFRVGDTLILYPSNNEEYFNSKFQLFKAYLLEVENNEILVSLAFPQHDDSFFRQYTFWNLEHDFFDSFHYFDQSLCSFLLAKEDKKKLFLGLLPPEKKEQDTYLDHAPFFSKMTGEQTILLHEVINSKDYYLLWGPPGTGKTSVMIRNLVAYYFYRTEERVLLLAFTNRAVDEICEAIESIGPDLANHYLRIGQVLGAAPKYRKNIFKFRSEQLNSRKELLHLLNATRIFVGTLSSIQKSIEILTILKFDRIIVDEASQLSDPSLADILTRVPHFLLIGDHNQLPGVVLQSIHHSIIKDDDLQKIGFYDLRDSVFERMIRRAENMEWTWAFGRLSHQGRMHREIMSFPGLHFYKNQLRILPEDAENYANLIQPLPYSGLSSGTDIEKNISTGRVCFFPTRIDLTDASGKSNQYEALMIVKIIEVLNQYFRDQGKILHPSDLGIITPYRAQIACIKEHLLQNGLDAGAYNIDTVERYQGSARRIIMYAPCLNYPGQLKTLRSMNKEGVDRKLNVAITRARDHFIMVGNPDLLKKSVHYAALIHYAGYV